MNKDIKPFDFNSKNYEHEICEVEGKIYYSTVRVKPFTSIEKSIIRKQNRKSKKTAIKVRVKMTDSPHIIAKKIEQKINMSKKIKKIDTF